MKTLKLMTAALATLTLNSLALAGDARTSATAGYDPLTRTGVSAATAAYDGRIGFARTDAHSGPVVAARGVAVGVDQSGLSLSVSTAVAPKVGPALAANFNISIGRDGEVSKSTGLAVAKGPLTREVTAGGETHTRRFDTGAASVASAKAPLGTVRVITRSRSR